MAYPKHDHDYGNVVQQVDDSKTGKAKTIKSKACRICGKKKPTS